MADQPAVGVPYPDSSVPGSLYIYGENPVYGILPGNILGQGDAPSHKLLARIDFGQDANGTFSFAVRRHDASTPLILGGVLEGALVPPLMAFDGIAPVDPTQPVDANLGGDLSPAAGPGTGLGQFAAGFGQSAGDTTVGFLLDPSILAVGVGSSVQATLGGTPYTGIVTGMAIGDNGGVSLTLDTPFPNDFLARQVFSVSG